MLLLLTTLSAAHAADLEVNVALAGQPPVSVTFHDVQPGPISPLLLAGGTLRMDVDVEPVSAPADCGAGCSPQVRLAVRLTELGRRHEKLVASPTIVALVGEPASVAMGSRSTSPTDGPEATDEQLRIELIYSEP